jgi:EmrB/QacA subfamily drug resistance transporter
MRRPSDLALVTGAMLSAMFVTALSTTIVATAAPSITAALQGLPLYSWVFAAYLLSMTVTMPLYGKLADLYGRKPVYVGASALFAGGSLLCGLATSMEQLIVYRLVQGLGAGALQPIAVTLAGDLYPIEQRARVQGWFSAMWGLASLTGPPLGGLLVAGWGWPWVFWLNIPIVVASAGLMAGALREPPLARRPVLDWCGAITLTGSVGGLLLGVFALDSSVPAPLPPAVLLAVALGLLGLFVWWEARAPEPLLPLQLLRVRVIGIGALLWLVAGVGIVGTASYTTLTVQGVLGGSTLAAGLALLPMDACWLLGSYLSGRLLLRVGYRPLVALGLMVVTLSLLAISRLGPMAPYPLFVAALAPSGLGFGCVVAPLIIAVQQAVGWHQRGVVTASTVFFRTVGGAVGVALLGLLLNFQLVALLPAGTSAAVLLDPAQRALLPAATESALRGVLWQGLQPVWAWMAGVSALGFAIVWLLPSQLPRARPEAASPGTASTRPAAADGARAR